MLDAAAYPHIFEAVLAFSPRASLLRLRGASKDVRARADAFLLPSHLTITATPNGPPITGPHGRLPAFAGWARADPWSNMPPREPDLSSVHVIDIDRAAGLEVVFDSLPEAVTVRFRRAVKHDMASSGITYFAPRQGDVFVLMEPLTALFSAEWRAFPALTDVLDRIVINTWSHPRDVVEARHPFIRVGHYTYGAEVVWVFHPETRPRTATGAGALDDAEGRSVGRDEMLRLLAAQLVDMLLEDVHITVVNLDSLTEGMEEDEVFDWIDPVLAFRAMCTAAPLFDAEQWGAEVGPEERGEIVDHIRFLTMEKYRAEVGDARADIETTWSGRG